MYLAVQAIAWKTIFQEEGLLVEQSLKHLIQSKMTDFFVWYVSVNTYSHNVSVNTHSHNVWINLLYIKIFDHHGVANVFNKGDFYRYTKM